MLVPKTLVKAQEAHPGHEHLGPDTPLLVCVVSALVSADQSFAVETEGYSWAEVSLVFALHSCELSSQPSYLKNEVMRKKIISL